DVALVIQPLKDALHHLDMAGFGGADEIRVRDIEPPPELLKRRDDLVDIFPGGHSPGFGRPLHLLSVVVGAREEKHLFSGHAPPPAHCVAKDRRVGVTDVQAVTGIVDRRCDVVLRFSHGPWHLLQIAKQKTLACRKGARVSRYHPSFATRLATRASTGTPGRRHCRFIPRRDNGRLALVKKSFPSAPTPPWTKRFRREAPGPS